MPRLIQQAAKLRAIQLRTQGKTYSEIRKEIPVSKGTLSYWSKKIVLSPRALARLRRTQHLHLMKARLAGVLTLRKKQTDLLSSLRRNIDQVISKSITPEMLRVALAFLHLGEGAKWKSHRGLQLGSSDPLILELYIKLLGACYNIDRSRFKCYICYRADQNLHQLKKYWAAKLGISANRFYDSKPDPRTVGKVTKNRNYMGVCIVSCAGSDIQQELEMIPEIILEKGL